MYLHGQTVFFLFRGDKLGISVHRLSLIAKPHLSNSR
jgi:hypothetical protein